MTSPIIIAIDGHSSTGKSTFAKAIARDMGYIYIDTGAMYRAVTLLAVEHNLISKNNTINELELKKLLFDEPSADVSFKASPEGGACQTYLNGQNVEKQIRTMSISNKVSYIAVIPFVREYVDIRLRKIGAARGVVMDGRDIGSAVFPDAELKIFMTASAEIRAKRRMDELQAKGQETAFEDVLRNIEERDYIDSHRETHPLTQAPDAVVLDNGNMTIEDQMNWFRNIIAQRFN